MGDHLARAEEFEKKTEKKLNGWGIFGSKYEDAANLLEKAANSYKLAKSWDQAGKAYLKLADCHLKSDSKHDAANAYAEAANCYKKVDTNVMVLYAEAASCLERAVNIFCETGRLNMAARYYKKIDQAIAYYEKAAEFLQNEEVTTSANQCNLKVAQYASQLEQYEKEIKIYEDIARHSLGNNLLKNIRILIQLLQEQENANSYREFDSMAPLDSWKTTMLLRVKEKLKKKELEEDDLT
ncbi:hypothetical protein Bca101_045508 [Brassica carinata]